MLYRVLLPIFLLLGAGLATAAELPRAIVANNHVMIPLRPLADWLGMTVTRDAAARTITLGQEGEAMTFTLDSRRVTLNNGEEGELPAPPIERNGVTYLPLIMFIGEGTEAVGNAAAGVITISTPEIEGSLRLAATADVIRAWERELQGGAADEPAVAVDPNDKVTPLPNGWTKHQHALGFQVKCPVGWQVTASPDGLIAVYQEQQDAGVLVLPFFLREAANAEQIVRAVPAVFSELLPEGQLTDVRRLRTQPDEAAGTLAFNLDGAPGQANILCSIAGRSGMLYLILGPQTGFTALKPTMLAVLDSLLFIQPASARQAATTVKPPKLAYVAWRDPVEKAFTVEVPKGWKVQGGLYRAHPVDVRNCLTVTSPDGRVTLTVGDKSLSPFMSPLPQLGFPEGSVYQTPTSPAMICRTFVPASQFAGEYVAAKFGNSVQQLALGEPCDLAEAVAPLNTQYANAGLNSQWSMGEVTFSGAANGKPVRGYCFVGLLFTQTPGAEMYNWNAYYLYTYRAAADQEAVARVALQHLVTTLKTDPRWQRMQQNVTAAASRIESQTHAAISDMIASTSDNRNAAQDNAARNWSNMMLGQTDVRDPETGQTWTVAAGHNYYWARGGTVAGTATADRPDIDFKPLNAW